MMMLKQLTLAVVIITNLLRSTVIGLLKNIVNPLSWVIAVRADLKICRV